MIFSTSLPHTQARLLEPKTLGRLLGLSMLLEYVFEMASNFSWQEKLLTGPDLLARAATMRPLLGSSAMVDMVGAVIGIALGVALMLRYQAQQPLLTRIYVGLLVALLAASMTEDAVLMAMGRLGADLQSLGKPDAVDSVLAEHLLRALRVGIHLPTKLLGGFTLTLFFVLLGRARAIPRALTIAGIVTALIQMVAVGMGVFGFPVQLLLLVPIGLFYPALGLWLTWRGLDR
ncbi:MAG: DUF4386 family protein [Rudaea sp.]|nr:MULTISPECIES: DUF4386 family protein [unclassified Rudaea]MBN8885146.1 DUF4386 family protein [Rudaea sp.]MBR0345753.1 DUF4386 family protein [Rudaea sp.]